jgi:hypothetical protein
VICRLAGKLPKYVRRHEGEGRWNYQERCQQKLSVGCHRSYDKASVGTSNQSNVMMADDTTAITAVPIANSLEFLFIFSTHAFRSSRAAHCWA